jgi:DNA-directed RNA polymerase subunit RPC12/RpoP
MPSKITTIKRIRVLGDFMMFGIFICLMIIFLNAYLNGLSNDNFTTLVDINSKNEAHVEFIILIVVLLPIFFMTTLWSFLDWKATWRARDAIRFQQYFMETESPRRKEIDTILMKCSACQGVFGVTAADNEMNIECPHCGKVGYMKLPSTHKTKKRPGRGGADSDDIGDDRTYTLDDDDDSGSSPRVRIIKDIKDR